MKDAPLPRLPSSLRMMIWSMVLLTTPVAAQQTDVVDPGKINDFRLDQPAGPGNPVREPVLQPTTPDAPTPQPTAPTNAQPKPKPAPKAQPKPPAPRPAAPVATPKPAATAPTTTAAVPIIQDASTETPPNQGAAGMNDAAAINSDAPLPTVSEGQSDVPMAETAPSTETAAEAAGPATGTLAQTFPYWPYIIGALIVLLFSGWLLRQRSGKGEGQMVENVEAEAVAPPAPTLDLIEPARPAPRPVPSGTVGVSAAKLFGAPPAPARPSPAPSAASQGFVTTRAPRAEAPRTAPPSGTIGIPASRILAPEPPQPPAQPAPQLVEGTRLAAQFAAPELIRDADGLRLKFAIGIGNIGTITAKDVRVRTVLLTAAPDSDRAIAEWLANPNGPAATTIDAIESGTQTNITGDIQLGADQIRAMAMQGNVIFVPMFAISIDFLGAEGLDRFGEAYVIGMPPERKASNGAARVLPLPHDEKLPRRWTDLVHRRADMAA